MFAIPTLIFALAAIVQPAAASHFQHKRAVTFTPNKPSSNVAAATVPKSALVFSTNTYPKYSCVVAIGASYQDNGHSRPSQYKTSLQDPPYVGGRKTNGPVMVESLYALTSAKNFYDYAYIGAQLDNSQTGGSVPDTKSQVASYISDYKGNKIVRGSDRTLNVFWAGINTILAIWYDTRGSQDLNAATPRVTAAINALASQIQQIQAASDSRTDLVILPIPPLETVPNPWYTANGNSNQLAFLGKLTQQYNDGVSKVYSEAKNRAGSSGQRVFGYDISGLWRDVLASPSKYGLLNVRDACWNSGNGATCSNPASYLYWDTLHPTTTFMKYIAQQVWGYVNTAKYL